MRPTAIHRFQYGRRQSNEKGDNCLPQPYTINVWLSGMHIMKAHIIGFVKIAMHRHQTGNRRTLERNPNGPLQTVFLFFFKLCFHPRFSMETVCVIAGIGRGNIKRQPHSFNKTTKENCLEGIFLFLMMADESILFHPLSLCTRSRRQSNMESCG